MIAIITEKPSVARDIARIVGAKERHNGYLSGNGYLVTWAFGHLITLAKTEAYDKQELPIIPEKFILTPRNKDVINQIGTIKDIFNRAERIICATDAGREGELIFRYIYNYLDCQKPFQRLWISSLTDKAISEGLENLKDGKEYDGLFYAAEARSQADWLIGINASMALCSILNERNNSLGRVQTPTLSIVCQRYLDHKEFKPTPYWTFSANIEKDGQTFKARGKESMPSLEKANEIKEKLSGENYILITSVIKKEAKEEAPLLYDLTELQKDANIRFGYSAETTLNNLQVLYEKKFTTYPRTGSRYIPEDIFLEIPALICTLKNHPELGKHAHSIDVKKLNKHSVDNDKITDHHAIIITENLPHGLTPEQETIYNLIASRFLEAFSPKCRKSVTTITAKVDDVMEFEAKGYIIKDAGWRKIKNEQTDSTDDEESDWTSDLPAVKENDVLAATFEVKEQKTKPKPLHTEASLLSVMENAHSLIDNDGLKLQIKDIGIGTPATRANIIETLFKRGYVTKQKKNLIPTDKGLEIYGYVRKLKISDVELTAVWEHELSRIESLTTPQTDFMESIKKYTHEIVNEISNLKIIEHPERQKFLCPKCKSRNVRFFLKIAACDNKGCGFVIFRTMSGKTIPEAEFTKLITKGETAVIRGFKKSKTKGTFDAKVILNNEFKQVFNFNK